MRFQIRHSKGAVDNSYVFSMSYKAAEINLRCWSEYMKYLIFKSSIVLSLLISANSSAFAQGTIPLVNQGVINFFTYNNSQTKGQIFMSNTTTPIGGGFSGQLWVSDVSATSSFAPLSAVATSDPTSGAFNVGTVKDVNDEAGSFVWYELVVWNTAAGSTFQAATGLSNPGNSGTPPLSLLTPAPGLTTYGVSSVVRVVLGGVDDQNNVYSVPQANGFNNLFLGPPVPEPTTIAIGGFGLVALLVFRGRNKMGRD